jgi:hypothetical protein
MAKGTGHKGGVLFSLPIICRNKKSAYLCGDIKKCWMFKVKKDSVSK